MHQSSAGLLLVLASILAANVTGSGDDFYIRYLPGELPVILSAPHGGKEAPGHIPNRTPGCWEDGACAYNHACAVKDKKKCPIVAGKDSFTQEFAMAVRDRLYEYTNRYPHVILCDLARRKLDANRDLPEAAQGVPEMETAWRQWHRHLDHAAQVVGRGLYFDLHCNGHPTHWVELGYLIPGTNLDSNDFCAENTSIRSLAHRNKNKMTFEELLRGSTSFGNFLSESRLPAVPSPDHPGPEGNAFFSGAYNTLRHGSLREGEVDAIQIESPSNLIHRDKEREEYAGALAQTILRYLNEHYDYPLTSVLRHQIYNMIDLD